MDDLAYACSGVIKKCSVLIILSQSLSLLSISGLPHQLAANAITTSHGRTVLVVKMLVRVVVNWVTQVSVCYVDKAADVDNVS